MTAVNYHAVDGDGLPLDDTTHVPAAHIDRFADLRTPRSQVLAYRAEVARAQAAMGLHCPAGHRYAARPTDPSPQSKYDDDHRMPQGWELGR